MMVAALIRRHRRRLWTFAAVVGIVLVNGIGLGLISAAGWAEDD